jgi:hypothetical protein
MSEVECHVHDWNNIAVKKNENGQMIVRLGIYG